MRGILPTWMERMLGIETVPGEGTLWSLEHNWPLPPWGTLLLVVFAVVFVFAVYAREGKARRRLRLSLAVVRLCLLGLVAMMIGLPLATCPWKASLTAVPSRQAWLKAAYE